MKKMVLKTFLSILLIAGFAFAANAQRFYVRVRPVAPVMVRPAIRPAGAIWVAGDYVWGGVNIGYRWRPGYYAVPPRPRAMWVPGYWMRERRGYYWRPGHWRY